MGLLELCNSSKLDIWCLNAAKSDRKAQIQASDCLNIERYTCECGRGDGWMEEDIFISPSSTQLHKYNIGFWVQSVNMSTSKGFTEAAEPRNSVSPSLSLSLSIILTLSTLPHSFWVRVMCFWCRVPIMRVNWGLGLKCEFICFGRVRNAGRLFCCRSCCADSIYTQQRQESSLHQWQNQSLSHFKCQSVCQPTPPSRITTPFPSIARTRIVGY